METLTSWEEKGMEKGRDAEHQAIALSLLEQNVPLETIAQATKLTIAQLQALQAQTNL